MTDNNSTSLRNALAKSIILYVHENELKTSAAAIMCDVGVSRMHKILRGDVENISSDYLANILGKFGYRLTAINGSGDGTEIVLSLDKAEGQALPEIERPSHLEEVELVNDEMVVIGSVPDAVESDFHDVAQIDPDAGRVVSDDE